MQYELASFLAVIGTALVLGTAPVRAEDGPATVEDAVAGFYSALNVMFTGGAGPMEAAWSYADDTTYMGPSGEFLVGWDAIQPEWAKQASRKLGGKVEPTGVHIIAGETLAVVNNWEKGENVDANGETQVVSIRASTVFRLEDGVWKIVGHQTDMLSFLSE